MYLGTEPDYIVRTVATIYSIMLNSRSVFSFSTIILAVAGIGIVILNAWANNNTAIRQLTLARGLWKFEPQNATMAIFRQQQAAWYKLLLAGLMMATLVVSILVRFYQPISSIATGVTLWSLWSAYLWYYWYSFVTTTEKTKDSKDKEVEKKGDMPHSPNSVSWSKRIKDDKKEEDKRLPVTIITGFLGSGKTTLIKRILNNTVGMKVMVIENEIGTEGIDHDLLMQHTAKEEIVLMNNGCICCNVRSDLLSTFRKMFSNEAFALLDWIVIETTGLADPAPLIQSFYMDSECQQKMRLDCVLTVADSKHLPLHLAQYQYDEVTKKSGSSTATSSSSSASGSGAHGGIPEAVLQLSFADKILLNKTDLVGSREVQKLTQQIAELNPYAAVIACQYGQVDIRDLLNVKAFDPKRFSTTFAAQYKDGGAAMDRPILIQRDAQGKILKKHVRVDFSGNLHQDSAGSTPTESSQRKKNAQQIRTISLVTDQALDFDAFNVWISQQLQAQGPNIYRLKGILHMHGYDEQFVCHGVHMIFEGTRSVAWTVKPSERKSRLVIIGKDLNQEQWETGFSSLLNVHK